MKVYDINIDNVDLVEDNEAFRLELLVAFSRGFTHVRFDNGTMFSIINVDGATIVLEGLEDVQELSTNCKNIIAIDTIIFNTLHQKKNLSPKQARTMIDLAQLRRMLLNE